jgi:GTPase involved in cell partitioning and DNA repair
LFNALTNSYSASAENFPFCTIEPNVGIVDVKDVVNPIVNEVSSIDKDALFAKASNYYRGGIAPTQEYLRQINNSRQLAEAKVKALGLWDEFVIYGEKLIESRKGEALIPSIPVHPNPIRISNQTI